jgi:hypothetical protein
VSRRNSLRVFASEIVRLCDIINIDDEIYCEVVWIHLQVMKMPPLREQHMLVCQIGEHADRPEVLPSDDGTSSTVLWLIMRPLTRAFAELESMKVDLSAFPQCQFFKGRGGKGSAKQQRQAGPRVGNETQSRFFPSLYYSKPVRLAWSTSMV